MKVPESYTKSKQLYDIRILHIHFVMLAAYQSLFTAVLFYDRMETQNPVGIPKLLTAYVVSNKCDRFRQFKSGIAFLLIIMRKKLVSEQSNKHHNLADISRAP